MAAEEIAPIYSRIFQTSLDIGKIPEDWREAHIVPLFKKGDKHLASNYRAVSLTSVTCKILEHIVHSNIIIHFLESELHVLCDNQHGFWVKHSCETQLITTIQGIASQLHSCRVHVDIILLDFSKAFDKVSQEDFCISVTHKSTVARTVMCRQDDRGRFLVLWMISPNVGQTHKENPNLVRILHMVCKLNDIYKQYNKLHKHWYTKISSLHCVEDRNPPQNASDLYMKYWSYAEHCRPCARLSGVNWWKQKK